MVLDRKTVTGFERSAYRKHRPVVSQEDYRLEAPMLDLSEGWVIACVSKEVSLLGELSLTSSGGCVHLHPRPFRARDILMPSGLL